MTYNIIIIIPISVDRRIVQAISVHCGVGGLRTVSLALLSAQTD